MKKIYIFLTLLLLVLFIPNINAEDELPVKIYYEQQNIIDGNGNLIGVELTFNVEAKDFVAIQHDMEFDSEKLELKEVTANGSFTATYGEIKKNGNKAKTTIVVDGDYAYTEAPYMRLYFEFTDKFKEASSAEIRFTNIKAVGLAEKLIRLKGKQITLSMNGTNMLSTGSIDIDEKFTIKEWIDKNMQYIKIGIYVIIGLVILDSIYVTFKNRKQKTPFNTNAQFTDNNAKHLRNVFTDTQENENKENGIDPDKYKYKSIILFLIGLSIIGIGTVKAVQGQKNQDIRNYIAGNKTELNKEALDISGDNIVDVLDLVMEKSTSNYEIIKINEWNTEFLRNLNIYHIDSYGSKLPIETYSVEYGVKRHIKINSTHDINAMECNIGTIENFKKTDEPSKWVYEFDYTLNEGKDECYMQEVN